MSNTRAAWKTISIDFFLSPVYNHTSSFHASFFCCWKMDTILIDSVWVLMAMMYSLFLSFFVASYILLNDLPSGLIHTVLSHSIQLQVSLFFFFSSFLPVFFVSSLQHVYKPHLHLGTCRMLQLVVSGLFDHHSVFHTCASLQTTRDPCGRLVHPTHRYLYGIFWLAWRVVAPSSVASRPTGKLNFHISFLSSLLV